MRERQTDKQTNRQTETEIELSLLNNCTLPLAVIVLTKDVWMKAQEHSWLFSTLLRNDLPRFAVSYLFKPTLFVSEGLKFSLP